MIYIILILFIYRCRKHTTRQIGCKITNNITQYQKPKAILTKTVKRFGRLRVLYYICSRIWKLEIQNLLISDFPVQGNQVQDLSCSCSCEPIVKLDNNVTRMFLGRRPALWQARIPAKTPLIIRQALIKTKASS